MVEMISVFARSKEDGDINAKRRSQSFMMASGVATSVRCS